MSAILAILAALSPAIGMLLVDFIRHKDDPKTANQKRYAQIDKDILERKSSETLLHADTDLDTLERLQNSKNH